MFVGCGFAVDVDVCGVSIGSSICSVSKAPFLEGIWANLKDKLDMTVLLLSGPPLERRPRIGFPWKGLGTKHETVDHDVKSLGEK